MTAPKKVNLTEDQKKFIRENWDKLDFKTLVHKTFKDETLDGRSAHGRVIKKYLSKEGYIKGDNRLKTSKYETPKFNLSPEDIKYIEKWAGEMSYLEIAREICDDQTLSNLSTPARVVHDYIVQHINPELIKPEDAPPEQHGGGYRAPRALPQLVNLVNKCAQESLDKTNLKTHEKDCLLRLSQYLSFPLFVKKISEYETKQKQSIFEATFVANVWDKSDLRPEDTNQYIMLSAEYILEDDLQKRLKKLDLEFDVTKSEDTNYTKILTAIEKIGKELNECKKRQQSLYNSLVQKLSSREQKKKEGTEVMTQLFEEWKKKESRAAMLYTAKLRDMDMGKEKERIKDLSSVLAGVYGLGWSEL